MSSTPKPNAQMSKNSIYNSLGLCGLTCLEWYAIHPLRRHRNTRFTLALSITNVVKNAASKNLGQLRKNTEPQHYIPTNPCWPGTCSMKWKSQKKHQILNGPPPS